MYYYLIPLPREGYQEDQTYGFRKARKPQA